MALGIATENGGNYEDRVPVLKFNAKAGRFFRIDRSQVDDAWVTNEVEIEKADFQAIVDMENIQVGWLLFATGQAPDFKLVPLGTALPPKPSDKHKQGFKVHLKLGKSIGGDVRELAGTAKTLISGIDGLHDAYTAQKAAHPGQLPVVAIDKITEIKTNGKNDKGQPIVNSNYQPSFKIVKWIDRPEGLTAAPSASAAAEPVAANEPTAQPVTQARTTSQLAVAPAEDGEEF